MLKKIPVWIILLILIIPSFFALLRPGFFWMQDDLQAFRIQQMDKCFQDFQIPCRWVPDPGYQYGYPQFNFYPPSVYYLGEMLHLTGIQFIDAVKILFILGFILSALTFFIFLRSLFGEWPALVGAFLYTYAPYKAVDVYVRGALSEFWAFVFFPLIFWSIYMLIKTGKWKYFIWMGLSIGLLLITHSLMSMIFLPIAGIWAVLWIILEKKWQIILKIAGGFIVGFMLAGFFILPMAQEKQYSHSESMLGGYFDYRQHFVDIQQMFISNHWGYGSSYLGPNDDLSLSAGQIQFVLSVFAIILSLIYFKKQKKIAIMVFVLFIVDLGVLFMTHQKSSFIWDKMSLLVWLQFPWRILADNVFILSILSAATIYLLPSKKYLIFIIGGVVVLTFIFYGSFYKPLRWVDISDKEKFSGELWEKQLTISIFDYLPIYAKLPPISKAPTLPEIMDGNANFITYKKGSNYQIGEVEILEKSNIRLPLFDFPGMKVFDNGKEIVHNHSDCRKQEFCLGLISFDLEPGNHTIKAVLTNTFVRTVGNYLTLIGAIILLIIYFKKVRHAKN
ncbi:MAG: hypothetical protein Q7S77_02315 [Candidatus Staskawiczbacteria bacterium]|nr:hypothetical protein [Candidatus Staskawiczbacteria bacterium]